jgi:TolA-binding protein
MTMRPLFQLRRGASGLEDWIALIASDPAALVLVVGMVVLIAVLIGAIVTARARRRRERQREADWWAGPERAADQAGIARWVEEGRHLLNDWQERIERLEELQSRLAAMAQEIGQLKAQVGQMEAVQAENLRLLQERDHVQAVLARIGELIQQATAARSRAAGEAPPGAGP